MKNLFSLCICALFIIISGCGPEPLTSEDIKTILSKEIIIDKQINPTEINLYVDLSSSMQNYLNPALSERSDILLYENYIRNIFASRQNAKINIYGFGDSISFLGSNNNVIQSLLNKDIYNDGMSRINLGFDKIIKDTTKSLNFVLSDAIYEDAGASGNTFGFLISPFIKEQVTRNKLFGVLVNKIGYYGLESKKVYKTPIYLFIFGQNSHNMFIENNYLAICDDYFLISPNNRYNVSMNSSQNTDLIFQEPLFTGVEIQDFSQAVNLTLNFERDLANQKIKNNSINGNYSVIVFEKNVTFNDNTGTYQSDSVWKRSPLNNPQCKLAVNRKDAERERVTLDFAQIFSEQNSYKLSLLSSC